MTAELKKDEQRKMGMLNLDPADPIETIGWITQLALEVMRRRGILTPDDIKTFVGLTAELTESWLHGRDVLISLNGELTFPDPEPVAEDPDVLTVGGQA